MPYRLLSRHALVALASIGLGACTMIGDPAASPPPPGPVYQPPTVSGPEGAAASSAVGSPGVADHITSGVVDIAVEAIGTPYQWGGTTDNGFDCSGLIQYAYARHGIQLPRVSRDQMRTGTAVTPVRERLRQGDVLGFSESRAGRATHVGLYIGDGRFIHSSSGGVRISSLDNRYWRQSLVAARRIVG